MPQLKLLLEHDLQSPSPKELATRRHPRSRPLWMPMEHDLGPALINRHQVLSTRLRHPDTYLAFAGPEFCDLIAATDNPPVVDLSVLSTIGNHTALIAFARNLDTGFPGDALVAIVVQCGVRIRDGRTWLAAAILHEDDSLPSFLYPYTEIGPNLAQVHWDIGNRPLMTDLNSERRLVANTLGLLAHRSIYT